MKFGTIIADPPWEYATTSNHGKLTGYSDKEYKPLTTESLCEVPVRELATDESVLLLWTTFPHIPAALKVIDAWGFQYVTGLGWTKIVKTADKLTYGVGYWFRGSMELVLVGKRKKAYRTNARGGILDFVDEGTIMSPPFGHSIKPDTLHEIVEQTILPSPYLEMFGRRSREDWIVIGNEAPDTLGEDIAESVNNLIRKA